MKPTLPVPVAISAQPKWFSPGAINPLFNRLADPRGGGDIPVTLDKDQLKQSIMDDVSLLFNTRSSLRWDEYMHQMTAALEWGIPDLYGLPDFSGIDPDDRATWDSIQDALQNALRVFEPRIKNAKVSVKKFENSKQNLIVHIQGTLVFEKIVEPIQFSSMIA